MLDNVTPSSSPEALPELEPPVDLAAEHQAALPAFYDLFEFALEVCLRRPERVAEIYERDAHLLDQVPIENVWLTRYRWENQADIGRKPRGYHPEHDLYLEEVEADPAVLGPPAIPEVIMMARAFGEALLEEAFEVLGEDAPRHVENWQKDDSITGRVMEVNWLLGRVIDIRDMNKVPDPSDEEVATDTEEDAAEELEEYVPTGEVGEGEDTVVVPPAEKFYHPARLSPKLMGSYPETGVEPTCLGVAMLAASFFHRAGEPTMLGGVMRTGILDARRALMLTCSNLILFSQDRDLELSPGINEGILANIDGYEDARDNDRGFHAAAITRFNDRSWIVIDPNFRLSYMMPGPEPGDIHQKLLALNNGTGGIELTMRNIDGLYLGMLDGVADKLRECLPDLATTATILDSLLDEAAPFDAIRRYLKDVLLEANEQVDEINTLVGLVHFHLSRLRAFDEDPKTNDLTDVEFADKMDKDALDLIDWAIESSIRDYVFPDATDEDLTPCLERCQRDPRYRADRINDFALTPHLVVLRLLSEMTRHSLSDLRPLPHSFTEVGLVEHRLGMCVLSDFAAYCGDELPPTFWTSNWSSHISWQDHTPGRVTSEAERNVAVALARVMDTNWLTYAPKAVMIDSFLEQEHPVESGDDTVINSDEEE